MYIVKSGSFNFHDCNKEQIQYLKKVCTHYDFEKEKYFNNYTYKSKVFKAPLYNLKVIDIVNKNTFKDSTYSTPTQHNLDIKISLRDDQLKAVDSIIHTLKEHNTCILQAMPSFGKSFILPFIINKIQQPTLILVDRTDLVIQMQNEFSVNAHIHLQQVKEFSNALIEISTFQWLLNNIDKIDKNKYGLIIIDEAHVIGALAFTNILSAFNAKYRLGLTATPTRSDGNQKLLNDSLGTHKVLGLAKYLPIEYIMKRTGRSMVSMQKGFAEAYVNFLSPDLIKDILIQHKYDKCTIIYSNYKVVHSKISSVLTSLQVKHRIINGGTPVILRTQYLNELEEGEINIIISGVILNKGISIKRLERIINLHPLTKEALEQLIGRLRRIYKTPKKPIFYDYWFGGILYNQGIKRVSFFKGFKAELDSLFIH